jgi:hypothetical protein
MDNQDSEELMILKYSCKHDAAPKARRGIYYNNSNQSWSLTWNVADEPRPQTMPDPAIQARWIAALEDIRNEPNVYIGDVVL